MTMKPIPENQRLTAGLSVLRHLHENAVELADRFPTGTPFTPIGTDGDTLKVIAETPAGVDTVSGSFALPKVSTAAVGAVETTVLAFPRGDATLLARDSRFRPRKGGSALPRLSQ
jgi:hypothetical protein